MADALAPETTFSLTDKVTWREIDGEIVALKMDSGEYYTFNKIGRTLWLALADGENVGQMVERIMDEYDVQNKTAMADLEAFLYGLVGEGLIHP